MLRFKDKNNEEQEQQGEQQAQNINLLIKHQHECTASQSTEQSKYNTATIEPGCCIQPIQIPDSKMTNAPLILPDVILFWDSSRRSLPKVIPSKEQNGRVFELFFLLNLKYS